MRVVFGCCLALLLQQPVAFAADIPGNKNTPAILKLDGQPYRSELEFPGDSDWWKINIVKGKHYDFTVTCQPGLGHRELLLLDDNGTIRTRSSLCEGNMGYRQPGFDFTAGITGVRYIGVKLLPPSKLDPQTSFPYYYDLRGGQDCEGAVTTTCAIPLGQPRAGTISRYEDQDWYSFQGNVAKDTL
jgi:hypothetical protein